MHVQITPMMQKPESFRVKTSEGEVVAFYFEPSATQNLKFSGFPGGSITWKIKIIINDHLGRHRRQYAIAID